MSFVIFIPVISLGYGECGYHTHYKISDTEHKNFKNVYQSYFLDLKDIFRGYLSYILEENT